MNNPQIRPEWPSWPLSEKLVQLAAYHCDSLHAHEEPRGSNRGPWVDRYLAAAGLPPGSPWCAAFVTYLLKQCGYSHFPPNPAAVSSWARWAEVCGRVVAVPNRGDLFFLLHANGEGHIGIVLEDNGDWIRTVEGNSNDDGSREGWEVVRHERPLAGLRFIRLRG
jgi:hypothetical protein